MNVAIGKPPPYRNASRRINALIALFCVVSVAALWIYTIADVRSDRERSIEQEFNENSNIALGFEELTRNVLKHAERTLRRLEHEYAVQGARLDVQKLFDDGLIDTTTLVFAGVIDEHGKLILGAPEFKAIDETDHEYYQFHQAHDSTEMLIGKPVLGRVRGKSVVPLTRRINKADGSFAGVAVVWLDPAYFDRLFERAKLGEQGLAILVGLDGIARARHSAHIISSGEDMRLTSLFAQQQKSPAGNFVSAGKIDGVPRYMSYRTLAEYPLIVMIGSSQAETLEPVKAGARNYYEGAALTSVLIVLFGGGLIVFLSRERRATEALHSSEARFGVAFSQASVGIVMARLDGGFLEVNDAFCRLLGYTREELLAFNYLKVTHPDDHHASKLYLDGLLPNQRMVDSRMLEKRYVRKDGTAVWAAATVAVVRDANGVPDYLMAVIQNITEQKRAQQELATTERRFRALIEHATDLIVITDRHGTITYISPSIKPIAGYDAQEALGRNFMEFAHPDDVPASRAVLAEIIQNPGRIVTNSGRFRHKDGSWLVFESKATNQLDDPLIAGIVVNGRDATARTLTEETLKRVNRTLKALSACNGILIRAEDETSLVQSMCDNIVNIGGYLRVWVGIVGNDAEKSVRPIAYAGYEPGFIERAKITWADDEKGRGPAGTAIRTRKMQVVQDVHADPNYRLWMLNANTLGYSSVVAFPLVSFNETLGVLTIYAPIADAFDAAELQLLNELADDLAYGMIAQRTRAAQQRSMERLQRSMEGTILAMAATLEMRDAYTAGHQRRVAELSVAIAREMGWSADEIHGLYLAAVVHDLGKIQIPAEILSKPSRLNPIEYELIKTHPGAGYNILKEVDFPWPIAQMVYQHHERLDGTGYPQGLKDAEILPGAKILAIADTVEAMASHRPYRPGLGVDKALEEILKHRATTYDAATADACAILFRQKGFKFSE